MSETMASLMPIPISGLQTSVVALESNLGAADPRLELRDGIHALLMRVGGDARDEVAVRLGVRGRVQRRFDLRIRRGGGADGGLHFVNPAAVGRDVGDADAARVEGVH